MTRPAFRRSLYSIMVLLACESYKSSMSMMDNLYKMTSALTQSEELESKSEIDSTLSKQYAETAELDLTESQSLKEHAVELQAGKDVTKSRSAYYELKAAKEESEAAVIGLEAAANEKIFQEELSKSAAESAKAAKEIGKSDADVATVATCEIIPFVDIVCDVVGTIAVIGFQGHAASLSAQSALGKRI